MTSQERQFWKEEAVEFIAGIQRGLEKESLRVNRDGHISQKPHPSALGSALTHPFITTDYSEALLEFITPPTTERKAPLEELKQIHQYVYHYLGDEVLWCTSMPCVMGDEAQIPIAQYGSSNSARMKTIYRKGLGHRYGRLMQTIAGVHYNFSFSESLWQRLYDIAKPEVSLQDFRSQRYMGLIRNFQRMSWLIPYLFGASPALCDSFLKGRPTYLKQLTPGTRYGKYATSLRLSDLGYQNSAQSALKVSFNSLDEYINALEYAIRTDDPYYREIGILVEGEYRQLNSHLLQIENEYYGSIRPKRVSQSGIRPTKALREGGIEYIEVRSLDLNPFSPIGVSQESLNFIDMLLLYCLKQPSPPITDRECAEIQQNLKRVVRHGRDPELHFLSCNREVAFKEVAQKLLTGFIEIANLFDKGYQVSDFSQTMEAMFACIESPEQCLSAKLLEEIEQQQKGFFPYMLNLSRQHGASIRQWPLKQNDLQAFDEVSSVSLRKQHQLEKDKSKSFEDFLADYYRD